MNTRILALFAALFLSSCAYMMDSQQQQITFNTLAAQNTACNVWVNGLRYKVYPPQTITVNRSRADLIVDCMAPGLRRKKVTIPAMVNGDTALNAANAGAGLPWDYFSESAFEYPSRIEVDFSDQVARKQPMPAQNAPDIVQPEEYDLDEYGPSMPRLNADRYRPAQAPLERRLDVQDEGGDGSAYAEPSSYSDKGDLMPVGTKPSATLAAPKVVAPAREDFGPIVPNKMANPAGPPQTVPSYPGE